jgi:hypothetical protein
MATATDKKAELEERKVQLERELRIAELRKKRDELFTELGGKLPASEDPVGFSGMSAEDRLRHSYQHEPDRYKAYQQLIESGATPESIKTGLGIKKKMDNMRYGKAIGGGLGGAATALAIGQIPPFTALPEEAVTVPLALKLAKTGIISAGAGAGGGLGEAAQTYGEERRLPTAGEVLDAMASEFAWEGGSRGAVAGGKFLLSPLVKKTIPHAADVAEKFSKLGSELPPTQIDKRLSLSFAEEISRGGFGAKHLWRQMAEKNATIADVVANGFLDDMAGGVARMAPNELANEVAEGITRPGGRIMTMIDDLFDGLYGRVDDLTAARTTKVMGDVTTSTPSSVLDELGQPIVTTKTARRVVGERTTQALSPGFEELDQFLPAGMNIRKMKQFVIKQPKAENALLKI